MCSISAKVHHFKHGAALCKWALTRIAVRIEKAVRHGACTATNGRKKGPHSNDPQKSNDDAFMGPAAHTQLFLSKPPRKGFTQ